MMSVSLSQLRDALPREGLFKEKESRLSPAPFWITETLYAQLERLGTQLWAFQKACNDLYALSVDGRQPSWIHQLLDIGKPEELLRIARARPFRNEVPLLMRPDLILTETGFVISELDSIPGGIGLTASLNAGYTKLGFEVLGGESKMIEGFSKIAPEGDILISQEAATYRPEMEWIAKRTGQRVCDAETYAERPDKRASAYRFFECFDIPNIPRADEIQNLALEGKICVTPPFKPQLEEKLWFALFWMRPLREFWRRALSDRHFNALQKVVPRTWVLDPTPLPPHAELPELCIQSFGELSTFSQKERELVIKASGFSERAWGARSVVIGSDVSQADWRDAVESALFAFNTQPHVLQRFHKAAIFTHSVFDAVSGAVLPFQAKVRLCPYYFADSKTVQLSGALATLCPPDKKILHGMRDAILLPTAVVPRGATPAKSA
jgi:hypothetical protein